ncbi:condensation domain-containing protein [Penicillium macrosclerotiorum]|uniref:condensation domain-containing protein n=1 Tax=Penicillium macrosclerotiorum TaxID=303699 RepID=UPI0025476A50|nr:condensation domain-containing protein [Penicillium macrosclerotiorum]KAJ5675351.1 condensation domain-containing protein [Penicillium macrosclerotiorum]
MLRARFTKHDTGKWEQFVCDESVHSFAFSEHRLQTTTEIASITESRHQELNIYSGPVFAADLFVVAGKTQFLFLVAHHLVIDLVSWRTLWYDLEHAIKTGNAPSQPITSFQAWCELQQAEAQSLSLDEVLPFPITEPNFEYWGLSESENTHAGSVEYNRHIDTETSSLLLGQSNAAFNTEVTDILVGILTYSFCEVFQDRQPPAVFLEGHGREPNDDAEILILDTVGWFTTVYPIQITKEAAHVMVHSVKIAKDIRRAFPGKGRPYFAYRYHNAAGRKQLNSHNVPELAFNYTGIYQQLEARKGLFQLEDQHGGSGRSLSTSSDTRRLALIEVLISVSDGCINISIGIHQKMRHQNLLGDWVDLFVHNLKIAAIDLASRSPQATPSDYPLLKLSNNQLEYVLRRISSESSIGRTEIENLYPCSPLQEGILLSIEKEAASYANYFIWTCTFRGDELVSPAKLQIAWECVAKRHSILSTVFVDLPGEGRFVQVLLQDYTPRTSVELEPSRQPADVLRKKVRPNYAPGEPNHRFIICQGSHGEIACRLDINHALIDAASISILMNDLVKVYQGESLPPKIPFSHFIESIASKRNSASIDFWARSLTNIKPCKFPTADRIKKLQVRPERVYGQINLPTSALSVLHSFCQKRRITRSVFIQVAWALVLSQFTGLKDICFGFMVSSRDLPMKGIENMVGPLVNILISRIDLNQSQMDIFETTYRQSVETLQYQHVSVAEIQHRLGFGAEAMFNTAMTIRETRQTAGNRTEGIIFAEVESQDPDEV